MSDCNGPNTLDTQQAVPITKLQETVTEVVKEVLTELRAGKKGNNKVTPS